ncbi:MAG: hypothetical protein RLZZ528_2420 [Pseudomonadota bacterium]|jgi:hypothetical protein
MKTTTLALTLIGLALTSGVPAFAATLSLDGLYADTLSQGDVEKRRKPRIPGGSGCDDPGDILEHPECAG